MLRFRLGPIPIQVHPSHFLVTAMMGIRSEQVGAMVMARSILTFMAIAFVSVLLHELGHAVVAVGYGYRPTVQLIWLGGVTQPNAPGPIPWKRDVLLTLAGPFAGGLLALAGFFLRKLAPNDAVYALLTAVVQLNVLWAVMNLLPVPPLDGGHVLVALCRRVLGPRGDIVGWGIGAVIGLSVAGLCMRYQFLPGAILFGLLGGRAASAAYALRGLSNRQAQEAEGLLVRAQTALDAGELDTAQRFSEPLNTPNAPPLVRARAERILGWVALKRGEGRLALDHFSQVQGVAVEPQAVAAAFSLVGDEARALPLWQRAHAQSGGALLRHEYAGALIRAGRAEEALRLAEVDPGRAYGCAERVLFLRGDFAGAARLGEDALRVAPSASAAYDAACAYARAGELDDAVRLLRRAAELGFGDADFAASDADLVALHAHSEWPSLLGALRESASR